MSGLARSGAILGFLMGCGLLLIWVGLPRHRRPGLAGRVVPYLRDTPKPSRLLDTEREPKGALAAVAAPMVKDLGALVERVVQRARQEAEDVRRHARSQAAAALAAAEQEQADAAQERAEASARAASGAMIRARLSVKRITATSSAKVLSNGGSERAGSRFAFAGAGWIMEKQTAPTNVKREPTRTPICELLSTTA